MSEASHIPEQRDFYCDACTELIVIPFDLPPTTGPCPHCGEEITSPPPPAVPGREEIPAVPATTQGDEEVTPELEADAPVESVAGEEEAAVESGLKDPIAGSTKNVEARPYIPKEKELPSRFASPDAKGAAAAPRRKPEPRNFTPIKNTFEPRAPRKVEEPKEEAETSAFDSDSEGGASDEEMETISRSEREMVVPEKKSSKGLLVFLLLLIVLLLAAGAGAYYYFVMKPRPEIEAPSFPTTVNEKDLSEANYAQTGWKKDATETLEKYLAASTLEERSAVILNSDDLTERLTKFYADPEIISKVSTPADEFTVKQLPEELSSKGIYLMMLQKEQEAAPSETAESGEKKAEDATSPQPVRVFAFFKKENDQLKLDWEFFVQTKYRLFKDYTTDAAPGESHRFRVLITKDITASNTAGTEKSVYRLTDPAYNTDSISVEVLDSSEAGEALAEIEWKPDSDKPAVTKTATIDLIWEEGSPKPTLKMDRFVCWEFLYLGGKQSAESEPSE